MKILFAMKSDAELRSLGGVISSLLDHGHELHLAFSSIKTPEAQAALERFAAARPELAVSRLPALARGPQSSLTHDLRRTADYLHYLDPVYDEAPKLRKRRLRSAPATARVLDGLSRPFGRAGRGVLRDAVRSLDQRLDPSPLVRARLREVSPDIVLATTLVSVGLPHADLVRAAKADGVRTAYLVFSWDNLTNKGLIREATDRVLLWNELQKEEAMALHGVPESRIRTVGAFSYDHWFDWEPSRTREEFAATVGLDPGKPIVLYTCSTDFIASREASFVRRWAAALRADGGPTAEAGILVRPHPFSEKWPKGDLGLVNLVVWPPGGQEPIERDSQQNYYDSLYYADAVVGINTSALIEAAIVGRPVHTILDDEFAETQKGTLHFHYLQNPDFGHLVVAGTLDEHRQQLAASLRGEVDPGRNERFVRWFLRPHGLDRPATNLIVESLEELAAAPPSVPAVHPLPPLLQRAMSSVSWRRLRRARRRGEKGSRTGRPLDPARGIAPPGP